jgi:hypothetical protein
MKRDITFLIFTRESATFQRPSGPPSAQPCRRTRSRSHTREEDAAPVRPFPSGVRYERQGNGMVRREQLDNGRGKVTAVANFSARIVRVRPGEVDRPTLSDCQRAGHDGRLAASMAAFLAWIANNYEQVHGRLQTRVLEIRSQGDGRAVHARLPTSLAELQTGWEIFLQFAFEADVIGQSEKEELEDRMQGALARLCALQANYQAASDPALRFVALLRTALATGAAHIADRNGQAPDSSEQWGWRKSKGQVLVPQGARIGWVGGSDLFLEPAISYEVAQKTAGAEGRHRLREHALLASVDAGRQMLLVRRTLEGRARQVLHLKIHQLAR